MVSYYDTDHKGCVDDRKSTIDYMFIMAGGALPSRLISSP